MLTRRPNVFTTLFIITIISVNNLASLTVRSDPDEEPTRRIESSNVTILINATNAQPSPSSTTEKTATKTTEMPSNLTTKPELHLQTTTESIEPQLNSIDVMKFEDDTSMTTTTTTTLEASERPEVGNTQASHYDQRDSLEGNEIHDRIGLAPSSDPAQQQEKPPVDSELQGPTSETSATKLTTSTSSYFLDGDQDDEYGLRKILPENSMRLQVGDVVTTPTPIVSVTEQAHPNYSQPMNRTTSDLQVLETNVSPKGAIEPAEQASSSAESTNKNQLAIVDTAKTRSAHWSSPLGAKYFVPKLSQSLDATPSTSSRVASSTSDDDQDKQLIKDTIIPQANIADLFHIIKHLNLINRDQDNDEANATMMMHPDRSSGIEASNFEEARASASAKTLGPTEFEPPQQIIGETSPSQLKSMVRSSQARPSLATLGMSKVSRHGYRSDVATSMLASPSSPSGSVEQSQRRGPSEQKRFAPRKDTRSGELDTKFLARFANSMVESTLSARKPSRLSLISPYSATFDTGLQSLKNVPMNRASVDSSKDQINQGVAYDNDLTNHKQANRPTQIKIGSKPSQTSRNQTTRNKSKQQNHNDKVQTTSSSSNGGQDDHQHRQQKDHQHQARNETGLMSQDGAKKPKTAAPSTVRPSTSTDSSNTKRGERDANSIKLDQSKQQAPYRHQILADENAANRLNKQQQQPQPGETSNSNINNHHSNQQTEPNGDPKKVTNSMDRSPPSGLDSLAAQPYNDMRNPSIGNGYEPSFAKPNHQLDDPHKKSFYWSPEHSDLYVDDFGLPVNQFPRPLTIGELAQHHGVNPFFGLTKPTMLMNDLNVNQLPHTSEDFGLFSESGLHEDYAQLSSTNQNHASGESLVPNVYNKNRLKLDDELKQKIAVKAFEAAMRDSELSATLLGNLLNMSLGGSGTTSKALINQQHPTGVSNHLLEQLGPNYYTPVPMLNKSNSINLAGNNLDGSTFGFNPMMRDHLPPLRANNPFNLMMPMATSTHDQVADTSLHAINPNAPRGSGGGSDGQAPVNLVLTDIANRWALSRMPDLVPIPLAATVPGYLIRLPNGKILAAALTNMFSIEGIQREPLNGSYKNMMNNKFNVLAKPNRPKAMQQLRFKQQGTYANLASDSDLRPTIVMPAQHNTRQQYNFAQSTNRFKTTNKNHSDRGGSLFSRGVMNQLGLLGGSVKSHNHHSSRHIINQSNKKQTHGHGTNRFINKSKMAGLLQHLPIADPSEPVFSFTDENELIDESDYNVAAPTSAHFNHVRNMQHLGNHLLGNDRLEQSTEANENAGKLLEWKNKLSSDEFIQYGRRKRKSPSRFTFAKLEPIMNWLMTGRKVLTRRDHPKSCND